MPDEQRRHAERITLKAPIGAMIGDMEAHIVEISLIGGRIEHAARLTMNSTVTLQFRWRGETVRLKAKISRTEMRSIGGKPGYSSGIDFAKSPEEAPEALQRIMASFAEPMAPSRDEPPRVEPPPPPPANQPAPFLRADEEVEEIEAEAEIPPYVECTWVEEQWVTRRVSDPKQPMVGFTMLAPENESEIDDFCRTYEVADPETQRMIRLSFELAIVQHHKK